MKYFGEIIKESKPTLVVIQHAGNQNAVDVKYLTESLRAKYGDKANIVRVDGSFNGHLKLRYKLKEYPTWILFKEGQELMRESGHKKEADLIDMINRALN